MNVWTLRNSGSGLQWINKFMGLKCAGDLINLGMFPNVKEITESMSAVEVALRCCLGPMLGDPNVAAYVIGDGCTPRTGALLAMRTGWQVYSVDPNMRHREKNSRVKRLHSIQGLGEKIDIEPGRALHVVIAVHSHAPWAQVWERIPAPKLGIAIPCCVPHDLPTAPLMEFDDLDNLSPRRTVKIWAEGFELRADPKAYVRTP